MDIEFILELTWIPLIFLALCLLYGILLITTKNPKSIMNKKNTTFLKDSEQYAVRGGKLLLFLGLGAAINCGLLFVDVIIAFIEIVAWFVVFAFMWKRMSDTYGPMQ